jgi:hypothetical protein
MSNATTENPIDALKQLEQVKKIIDKHSSFWSTKYSFLLSLFANNFTILTLLIYIENLRLE